MSGLVLVAACATNAPSEHDTVQSNVDWAAGGIRIEYDNDLLVNSDDKFTNGFSVQWHSDVAAAWDDVGVPRWMKFGSHLPGMQTPKLYNRVGLAIG